MVKKLNSRPASSVQMEQRVIINVGIPTKEGQKHKRSYVGAPVAVQGLAKSFDETIAQEFDGVLKHQIVSEITKDTIFQAQMKDGDAYFKLDDMLHFPRKYCLWCNERQPCDENQPCSETMRCKIHILPHSPCDTFPVYLQAFKRHDHQELCQMVHAQFPIHGGWDNIISGGPNPTDMNHWFPGWYHDYMHFSRGGNEYHRETPKGPEKFSESRIRIPVLYRSKTEEVEAIVYVFARGLYSVDQVADGELPKNYWRKLGIEMRVFNIDEKGIRKDDANRTGVNAQPKTAQKFDARYMFE